MNTRARELRLHEHNVHQRQRTGRRRSKDADLGTRPCAYFLRAAASPENTGVHRHLDGYRARRQIRSGANTNKMLKSYQGLTGLKTGYIREAGFCISASAERDGLSL